MQEPPRQRSRGRRCISVSSVSAAVATQERADAAHLPGPVTSLMGAIRMFAPLILTRKAHGFTDPQIVAMLAEHGIDISVETLRVYRSRLKRDRKDPNCSEPQVAAVREPAGAAPSEQKAEPKNAPFPAATGPPAESAIEREPTKFNRRITFDDGV